MRVDVYRRPETNQQFSYLAVPEGRSIPQEAINTDWSEEARGVELDESLKHWDDYPMDTPASQIAEKGYAISGLRELGPQAAVR